MERAAAERAAAERAAAEKAAAERAAAEKAASEKRAAAALATAVKPGLPTVGDRWQYRDRATDRVNKSTTGWRNRGWIEVKAVADRVVIDTQPNASGSLVERRREPGAAIDGFLTQAVYGLSPYLHLQQQIKEGDRWSNIRFSNLNVCSDSPDFSCKFSARVAGREKVTVAAGTFDAYRVEVRQEIARVRPTNYHTREGVYWFAPSAKRYVKITWKTVAGDWRDPDMEVELLSFKLN